METIKDYLHLYLGCEMLVGGASRVFLTPNRFDVVFRNHDNILQLLLLPLSSMTEEEKYNIQFELQCFYDSNANCHPLEYVHYSIQQVSALINEYRKRGYDCDNLIEKGLAIDATKLSKEPDVQVSDTTGDE